MRKPKRMSEEKSRELALAMDKLSKAMDSYNKVAAKHNYVSLWYDIKNHVVLGGCMKKKQLAKKENIFTLIAFIFFDGYMEWRYKKIMAISRKVWKLQRQG